MDRLHASIGGSRACPTARRAVSTWTRCDGRLAPRRANEGYTAELPAFARLVCQAYHRRPGRTARRAPVPQLAHSGCPQSRSTSPLLSDREVFP